ncbi:MAG: pyridoxamine kinase [Lachnospiraceae bacterium]|nr:pyridoxamine kinase [Lachnospiraceae bacterium]
MSFKYRQKKIALINDISGYGRCSLAVEIPVISALKVQCCPLITSILSNHTGYSTYFFDDYTDKMVPYIENWKKLGIHFDGIATGFLGSKEQIDIVKDFIEYYKEDDTIVVIDPVMGDHGRTYATYTKEMCAAMKRLLEHADITTPNLTEACVLTDTQYHDGKWKLSDLYDMACKITAQGPKKVVITGIIQGDFLANYIYEKGSEPKIVRSHKLGTERSGTGDIFASIISADAVNGVEFSESVKKASRFISRCIKKSIELDIPVKDGVCFEEVLHTLK